MNCLFFKPFLVLCIFDISLKLKKEVDRDSLCCTIENKVDLVYKIGYYNGCVKFKYNNRYYCIRKCF